MSTRLHYIYDPFCGWCYGATTLVQTARQIPGLEMVLHGGGMFSGSNQQAVNEALRQYVMPHDRRIAALTGQPFGEAYFNGLLRDHAAVLDSDVPIAAILAAEARGRGLDLLKRIQTAHFVEGRRVAEPAVLTDLAVGIGLERAAFQARLAGIDAAAVQTHTRASNHFLARVGGRGYPTFVLEQDGRLQFLDISAWLPDPAGWQAMLMQQLPQTDAIPASVSADFGCGPESCEVPGKP